MTRLALEVRSGLGRDANRLQAFDNQDTLREIVMTILRLRRIRRSVGRIRLSAKLRALASGTPWASLIAKARPRSPAGHCRGRSGQAQRRAQQVVPALLRK